MAQERLRQQANRDHETEDQRNSRLEADRDRNREAYQFDRELEHELDELVVGGLHLWAFHDREQLLEEDLIELNYVGINNRQCDH